MGFSVSASAAILFTSILLSLSVLYPAWYNAYSQVKDAEKYSHDLEISRISSKLDLENYTSVVNPDSTYNITFVIRNDGLTLTPSYWTIVYDGAPRPALTPSQRYLLPGENITINVTGIPLNGEPHVIWIFTENGCGLRVEWYDNGTNAIVDATGWACPREVS
ncbi:hypothetical protein A3L12_07555 [Thermococcus sp. P6]|uniref:flagella n=1 Tax=Thermococcus sp. P6 TaxID=122420 RepID=UPI000B5A1853|nr:flagella [Thermococcus sp. P6]ASJ11161.1 hypothetical protein A3L12_07555 [Thermococcus sp. P6]